MSMPTGLPAQRLVPLVRMTRKNLQALRVASSGSNEGEPSQVSKAQVHGVGPTVQLGENGPFPRQKVNPTFLFFSFLLFFCFWSTAGVELRR